MPMSDYTRRQLQIACGSVTAGDDIAAIIDADGGTMAVDSRRRVEVAIGDWDRGDQICDAIDADGALSAYEVDGVRRMVGGPAAVEINTEQGS
ncbi:MAG: hypothetical protein ACYTBS_26725 [Planctomycetota bacterium]|jgi:hypothetical protein